MENKRVSLSDTETSLLDTCLGSAVLRYREIAAEMLAAEQSKGGNLMGFYRQFARQADDAESLRLKLAEAGSIWLCEDAAEGASERYRVVVRWANGRREESDLTPEEVLEMSQGENEYLSLYCGMLQPGEVHRSGGGASPIFEITRL